MYNRCTGIYKFENTYPRRIRRRWNLGHIFREKIASYGPGNAVHQHNRLTRVFIFLFDAVRFYISLIVACNR